MKSEMKSIKKYILSILLFVSVVLSYAQESSFNLDRQIYMHEPDSQTRNISLNVKKDITFMTLQIASKINFGTLTIIIFNSKDEIVDEFSIENKTTSLDDFKTNNIQEVVTGQITKSIKDPIPGKWKIKMVTEKAVGQVQYTSIIYSN